MFEDKSALNLTVFVSVDFNRSELELVKIILRRKSHDSWQPDQKWNQHLEIIT